MQEALNTIADINTCISASTAFEVGQISNLQSPDTLIISLDEPIIYHNNIDRAVIVKNPVYSKQPQLKLVDYDSSTSSSEIVKNNNTCKSTKRFCRHSSERSFPETMVKSNYS